MRISLRALVALVATLVPFAGPVAPARALSGAVVFEGDVVLPQFPCGGPGCFANFAADIVTGALGDAAGVGVVTGLVAEFNYSEMCTAGEALTGTARGVVHFGGLRPQDAYFSWTRVGVVGVIQPQFIASPLLYGAALFLPTGGLPVCTGGQLTATLMGAVVAV